MTDVVRPVEPVRSTLPWPGLSADPRKPPRRPPLANTPLRHKPRPYVTPATLDLGPLRDLPAADGTAARVDQAPERDTSAANLADTEVDLVPVPDDVPSPAGPARGGGRRAHATLGWWATAATAATAVTAVTAVAVRCARRVRGQVAKVAASAPRGERASDGAAAGNGHARHSGGRGRIRPADG